MPFAWAPTRALFWTSNNPERTLADLRQVTGGRGADVVIEAVGQPEAWELATHMVRHGGTVNFFGGCASGTRVGSRYAAAALFRNHLQSQLPSHAGPYPQVARIVASGRVTANHLVNREEPLDNLLAVMRDLMSRNGHIKTAIIP